MAMEGLLGRLTSRSGMYVQRGEAGEIEVSPRTGHIADNCPHNGSSSKLLPAKPGIASGRKRLWLAHSKIGSARRLVA